MCSLLGKESLPAGRSMQQNRNMELLGEHKNIGMHAHMRTHFHREDAMTNIFAFPFRRREKQGTRKLQTAKREIKL